MIDAQRESGAACRGNLGAVPQTDRKVASIGVPKDQAQGCCGNSRVGIVRREALDALLRRPGKRFRDVFANLHRHGPSTVIAYALAFREPSVRASLFKSRW